MAEKAATAGGLGPRRQTYKHPRTGVRGRFGPLENVGSARSVQAACSVGTC